MPRRIRTLRRTAAQVAADVAAEELTVALGKALRDARRSAGLSQAEVGRRSALAQTAVSRMESGAATSMSLRSWSRVAHVLGSDLRAYLARRSAADAPRDSVHLRTQELLARTAEGGAWKSIPEYAIDDAARGTRSLDLWLERRVARGQAIEVAAIEVMDWFDDVGARFRDWDRRLERVRQLATATRTVEGDDGPVPPRVSGCWVVRATTRNRQLLREHVTLFDARFPGSGRSWLDALTGSAAMPVEPAILWVSVDGTRLFPRQRTVRGWTSRVGAGR
jgi:transcriptional regulator with XRE-family HTH domain